MAAPVRIKWRVQGFREIRTSPEVENALREYVNRGLAQLDDKYVGGVDHGTRRSRGYIVTADIRGMTDQAYNHTLTALLGQL